MRLVVYESEPRNAAVLARLADVELVEVRSLTQLRLALDDKMPDILAVEVTLANLVEVSRTIHDLKVQATVGIIGIPESNHDAGVSILHEAGVDLVFRSMLDAAKVAAFIERRRQIVRSCNADTGRQAWREQIWARIPWKRHATGGSR